MLGDTILFLICYFIGCAGAYRVGRSAANLRWAAFMRGAWTDLGERFEFAHITGEPMDADSVLIAVADAFGAEKAPR